MLDGRILEFVFLQQQPDSSLFLKLRTPLLCPETQSPVSSKLLASFFIKVEIVSIDIFLVMESYRKNIEIVFLPLESL